MPDLERGETVVRQVLLRAAWFSTVLAALPALVGYGTVTPTRVVRLLIVIGICVFIWRGRAPRWAKWLLVPPVAGWLIGSGGAAAFMRPFSAWSLLFFGIGLVYVLNLLRLWRDPDAVAYLERGAAG